jgi:hypothetical protein
MNKREKKYKKQTSGSDHFSPEMMEWVLQGMDGKPASTEPPSPELAEEINRVFMRKFKKSPMWKNMIADFGREKAEEMLKQIRVEGKDE